MAGLGEGAQDETKANTEARGVSVCDTSLTCIACCHASRKGACEAGEVAGFSVGESTATPQDKPSCCWI